MKKIFKFVLRILGVESYRLKFQSMNQEIVQLREEVRSLREEILLKDLNVSVEEGYRAGLRFYEQELQNDPELLKWIKKKDYYND